MSDLPVLAAPFLPPVYVERQAEVTAVYTAQSENLQCHKSEAKALARHKFRRVDRFTQMALVGASHCVGDLQLDANTGLYIASATGPLANTEQTSAALLDQGQLPRPVQFINTLSNAVNYFVARNFDFEAGSQWLSRGAASLHAALEQASMDLNGGGLEHALVGCVEECVLPLAGYGERMGFGDRTMPAEGSHWWLLSNAASTAARRVQMALKCFDADGLRLLLASEAIQQRFEQGWRLLCCEDPVEAVPMPRLASVAEAFADKLWQLPATLASRGVYQPRVRYALRNAAMAQAFFKIPEAQGRPSGLLLVSADHRSGYYVMALDGG